jgi:peptidoglycan hydrolase-like protein with peptidoglycan-binding domain
MNECLIIGQHHILLEEIQELLQSKKIYQGQINGLYDEATAAAITLFQEQDGLKTGGVTALTLCRLLTAATQSIASEPATVRTRQSQANAHVLIQKGTRQLTIFNGNSPLRNYPVAIGKPSTPTPVGNYAIASKVLNPGGMLGSRWMGLNYDTYGIHGTSKP